MKKHAQVSSHRLIQYSAAALGVLATQGAHAQVAYTDLDPDIDLHYFTGDTYLLDLNNDGIDDFEISAIVSSTVFTGSSSSVFTSYTYRVMVTPLLDNEVFVADDGELIDAGLTIDADLGGGSFTAFAAHLNANNFEVPSYIGLQLNSGGATNYGWLRLTNDMTSFTLLDYAVELTDGAGIYAQVPGGPYPVTDIATADISDTHTPADVQVSFSIPDDETNIISYRIFAGETLFAKLQAINADADQYTEVFPTGSDQVVTLDADQLDYYHNPVEEFDKIVVGVLSVSANDIYESLYQTYIIPLVPGHAVAPVSNIEITHIPTPYPATSFEVHFTSPSDLHGIINFMSYMVPADMLPVIDSTLLFTNPNHAVLNSFDVLGDHFTPDYIYEMPATGYDISGNGLTFGGQYAVCIQSHTQWPEYADFAYEVMTCSDTFTLVDETIGISEMLSNEMNAFVDAQGIHLQAVQHVQSLELLSADGKVVYSNDHITDNAIIPLPNASGVYFVRAKFDSGYGIKQVLVAK